MTTRRFVLEPSAEIASDLRHPTAGCSVGELLENISQPHPHVAVTGVPETATREVAEAVADRLMARLVPKPGPPPDSRDPMAWEAALDAWSRALAENDPRGHGDRRHHGVVSVDWPGKLWLDPSSPLPHDGVACADHCPNVVLLLLADERRLPETSARSQARLVEVLLGRSTVGPPRPKAVVPIRADPVEQAIEEAVAAVEAMG